MYKKIINYLKSNFPRSLKTYYLIRFVFRAIYQKEPRAHLLWILKRGDSKSYKKFNLNSNSIFFDVGGYEGEYTDRVTKFYDCWSYVFEPHPYFYEELKQRFKNNKKVQIFNYGLGGKTETLYLTDNDQSSKVSNQKTDLKILVKNIEEVITDLNIKTIDLLKLNIEGSEYDLIERLIETDYIKKVEQLKIQFHDNVNDAKSRRVDIRNKLSKTHSEIWSYYFIWEYWKKIS